jgi:hypothetical protein
MRYPAARASASNSLSVVTIGHFHEKYLKELLEKCGL